MKYFLPFVLCFGVLCRCLAQDPALVDSLEKNLSTLKKDLHTDLDHPRPRDTLVVNTLVKLSEAFWTSDPGRAIDFAHEVLMISEKIGYSKGVGAAYHSLGSISSNIGDYEQAISFFQKSLDIRKQNGNPENIAGSELNLGAVYWKKGDYAEAMRLYLSALRRYEGITGKDQTQNIAGCHLNIGILHAVQGQSREAIARFNEALDLFKKAGDKEGQAFAYANLSAVSTDLSELDKMMYYDSLSLQMLEEVGNRIGVANGYNSLAYGFELQGKNDLALENYEKALTIAREAGSQSNEALTLMNMGSLKARMGKYREARTYFQQALAIAEATGSYPDISDNYRQLASLDSTMGDYASALANYKKYVSARDTLFNQDRAKKLTRVSMQYNFDKKETAARLEQEKKDALATREAQRQRLIRNILLTGAIILLIFAIVFFTQRNTIAKGKKRSDNLLLNILPAETAAELKETGKAEAKNFDQVTVLFTDFKNFTSLSEKLTARELVAEINHCYSAFDKIITRHGIEKIKTIGDSYMCAGGLPVPNDTNALTTVTAALELRDFMRAENARRQAEGKTYFEIRIGCNTGPVVAGIVGIKKYSYDIWGDTVNTASRMESASETGKVNISGSTYNEVKNHFRCTYRGKIPAKGKGDVDMYFVEPLG